MTTIGKVVLAFCRVSSKEQEMEGNSLDVQSASISDFANRKGWKIHKVWTVAESAKSSEERKAFNEMLRYAEDNTELIDGIIFKSVDRATRNTQDLARLEAMWARHEIDTFIVDGNLRISDSTNSFTIAIHSAMARNESLRYREKRFESIDRMAREGKMPYRAPFGYENFRVAGQSGVRIHTENGPKVKRIFQLMAEEHMTVRSLIDRLFAEGIRYSPSVPKFSVAKMHTLLTDRSYVGDIKHKGNWLPGKQDPIVDEITFDRVGARLGNRKYTKHEVPYSGMIACGHCGRAVTGERIHRGTRNYTYYRCSGYTAAGHPRIRLPESEVEAGVLSFLQGLSFGDEELRAWFRDALRASTLDRQESAEAQRRRMNAALAQVRKEEKALLQMRLRDEMPAEVYAEESASYRTQRIQLEHEIASASTDHDKQQDAALRAFELAERVASTWLVADSTIRRVILETTSLNIVLRDRSLEIAARSPFDLLVEVGETKDGRSEKI